MMLLVVWQGGTESHSQAWGVDVAVPLCCSLPSPLPQQAGAILKAEVYGIPKPEWASDPAAVAAAAAKVPVPEFQPKKGVRIETDPKVC